jgi:hypothetical protein
LTRACLTPVLRALHLLAGPLAARGTSTVRYLGSRANPGRAFGAQGLAVLSRRIDHTHLPPQRGAVQIGQPFARDVGGGGGWVDRSVERGRAIREDPWRIGGEVSKTLLRVVLAGCRRTGGRLVGLERQRRRSRRRLLVASLPPALGSALQSADHACKPLDVLEIKPAGLEVAAWIPFDERRPDELRIDPAAKLAALASDDAASLGSADEACARRATTSHAIGGAIGRRVHGGSRNNVCRRVSLRTPCLAFWRAVSVRPLL